MADRVHARVVLRPALDLDLDLPLARRYAQLSDAAVACGKQLLRAVLAEIPSAARPLADAVRLRTSGRFQAEAEAVAARFGASWRDVILASISYDLTIAMIGCSTMALASADGPVLARNLDWWPEALLARTSFQIRAVQGGAARRVTAGWPGALGVVTGMASGRFALAINAVSSPDERVRPAGYPVLLHLRRVLEDAASFDEALRALSETRLVAPCLLTLVGTRNHERAVIERTPTRHRVRRPEGDAPLYATNDYRALDQGAGALGQQLHVTSCSRYDALARMLGELDPRAPVRDERLLAILGDRDVIQEITAQHVIARPAQGTLRVWIPARFTGLARVF